MERPIIFSTEMVKAILDGRKTMTRRVVKDPRRPSRERDMILAFSPGKPSIGDIERELELTKNIKPNYPCPYGQVGDRLWVRETWATQKSIDRFSPSYIGDAAGVPLWYKADAVEGRSFIAIGKWRPSIFMPCWASRLTLEITGVRVERLQEIAKNSQELRMEGVPLICYKDNRTDWVEMAYQFSLLWDSLNAKRGYSWNTNPWVWVIKFDNLGLRVK